MTRTMCLAGILVTVLVTAPAARQSLMPPDWSQVTGQLEQAVLGDDAAGVRRARTDLLRLLAAGPATDRAALVHYAIAYAGWRLSTNPAVTARERDDLLDDAETRLKTAVKLDPKFAEGYALLSGVYGLKINFSPMSGILLGPRSGGAIDRAEQLEPENPRVLLSRGIGKFNTPAMFGGSITAVSGYTLVGSYTGRSTTHITVTFTAQQANPVLAWGGHLAATVDWGLADGGGAAGIPGSSFHMGIFDLSGKNVGNQNRSISGILTVF